MRTHTHTNTHTHTHLLRPPGALHASYEAVVTIIETLCAAHKAPYRVATGVRLALVSPATDQTGH